MSFHLYCIDNHDVIWQILYWTWCHLIHIVLPFLMSFHIHCIGLLDVNSFRLYSTSRCHFTHIVFNFVISFHSHYIQLLDVILHTFLLSIVMSFHTHCVKLHHVISHTFYWTPWCHFSHFVMHLRSPEHWSLSTQPQQKSSWRLCSLTLKPLHVLSRLLAAGQFLSATTLPSPARDSSSWCMTPTEKHAHWVDVCLGSEIICWY